MEETPARGSSVAPRTEGLARAHTPQEWAVRGLEQGQGLSWTLPRCPDGIGSREAPGWVFLQGLDILPIFTPY